MEPNEATAQLTFGEKAVGLTFNPSGDERVLRVKRLYADIIDLCNGERTAELLGEKINGDRANCFYEAIKQAQTAQMWAVKAITWKD